jgi:hypothetical protein
LTTATGGARTVDAFDGQIDQVNTWQGALTADQIAALFNACPPLVLRASPGHQPSLVSTRC